MNNYIVEICGHTATVRFTQGLWVVTLIGPKGKAWARTFQWESQAIKAAQSACVSAATGTVAVPR